MEQASAPFLAVRCCQYLADEQASEQSHVATVIANDFYVDDVLSGTNTKEGAKKLVKYLNVTLARSGFLLRKWQCNYPDILENVENAATSEMEICDTSNELKTLGIYWTPVKDTLDFKVHPRS